MKDNGKIIDKKVKAFSDIKIVLTKVSLLILWNKVKDNKYLKMVISILDNIKKVDLKVLENIFGQMKVIMKVILIKEWEAGLESG